MSMLQLPGQFVFKSCLGAAATLCNRCRVHTGLGGPLQGVGVLIVGNDQNNLAAVQNAAFLGVQQRL